MTMQRLLVSVAFVLSLTGQSLPARVRHSQLQTLPDNSPASDVLAAENVKAQLTDQQDQEPDTQNVKSDGVVAKSGGPPQQVVTRPLTFREKLRRLQQKGLIPKVEIPTITQRQMVLMTIKSVLSNIWQMFYNNLRVTIDYDWVGK